VGLFSVLCRAYTRDQCDHAVPATYMPLKLHVGCTVPLRSAFNKERRFKKERGRGRRPFVAMEASGQSPEPRLDPERPQYHVMPRRGWVNDPNGPVYFNGNYHLYDSSPALCKGFAWPSHLSSEHEFRHKHAVHLKFRACLLKDTGAAVQSVLPQVLAMCSVQ
jgi:hypothetical protein